MVYWFFRSFGGFRFLVYSGVFDMYRFLIVGEVLGESG